MQNPTRLTAEVINRITDPLVLFLITIFIILSNNYPTNAFNYFFPIILIFPIAHFFVSELIYANKHTAGAKLYFSSPTRKQRDELYLALLIESILLSLVYGSSFITNLFLFELTMITTIFFAIYYMVNKYIDKVSLHVGTYIFCVLLLAHTMTLEYSLALVSLPVIYWAGISTHHHTWYQMMWGSIIGVIAGLLTWTIVQ